MRRIWAFFGLFLAVSVLLPNVAAWAQDADDSQIVYETPTADPSASPDAEPTPDATPTAPPAPSALPSPPPDPTAAPPTPAPLPRIPILPRTPPHDTTNLVTLLEPLTEWGLPLEQVLIEGMGCFPVAGRASYSDDWLAPRYTPTFHLHKGLDIFADLGVPIRAPDAGVVAEFSDSYPGGVGVTIRNHDRRTYYFGHMMQRAPELQVGQSVELGTVLGYVGNTGNAAEGPTHLHFEIREHGAAIPPKPIVDRCLEEAENAAGDFIEARRVEIDLQRQFAASVGEQSDLAGYQMDLLLGPQNG